MNVSKIFKNYIVNRELRFSPRIVFNVIRGYIRARAFGKNTLRVLEIFPTYACQMECEMCSIKRYEKKKQAEHLSIAEYETLADEALRMGVTTVIILGGEPTIDKRITDIISVFSRRRLFIHMVSNGLILNEERLKSYVDSGLDSLFLSFQSTDPIRNDEIMGEGHHDKTLKNIELCKKVELSVGVAPVFFSGKVAEALDVVDFANKNDIAASGGLIAPTGNGLDEPLLSKSEVALVRAALKKYNNFLFDWNFSYFSGHRCPAGTEKIGVTAYGDIVSCSYIPIGFGNIRNESLKCLYERIGTFSQYRQKFVGCNAAENEQFIEKYLKPAARSKIYPLPYYEHPNITPDNEVQLYKKSPYKSATEKVPLNEIS